MYPQKAHFAAVLQLIGGNLRINPLLNPRKTKQTTNKQDLRSHEQRRTDLAVKTSFRHEELVGSNYTEIEGDMSQAASYEEHLRNREIFKTVSKRKVLLDLLKKPNKKHQIIHLEWPFNKANHTKKPSNTHIKHLQATPSSVSLKSLPSSQHPRPWRRNPQRSLKHQVEAPSHSKIL